MGATLHRRPEDALAAIAGPGESVLLVGLDDVANRAWAPLEAAGLRLLRAASAGAALRALAERAAHVVRTFASVTHPDDVECVEVAVFAAADEDRPYGLEYRLVRPDGSIRWVL